MQKKHMLIVLALLCTTQVFAYKGEIAITIDDLPFVGTAGKNAVKLQREKDRFNAIKQALLDHKVPATGFIIAGTIEKGQWALLEDFRKDGFTLGNHTFSHKDLAHAATEKYIHDIDRADKKLSELMTNPKFFRYPYLAEATGAKRKQVYAYLAEHDYHIAPVTIDSKDFKFNSQLYAIPNAARTQQLPALKKRYLNYVWKQTLRAEALAKRKGTANRQILLIHANVLNSQCLEDLLALYEKNDYRFISLEEALQQ